MTEDSVQVAEPSAGKAQVNDVSPIHNNENGEVEVRINGGVEVLVSKVETPAPVPVNDVKTLVNGHEDSSLSVPANRESLLHPATKKA